MHAPAALRHTALPSLAALVTFLCHSGAQAADTYSAATATLSIPTLGIGSATYSNVVLTGGRVLKGPAATAPNNTQDTYNPTNQQLLIPAVTLGQATYHNVVATGFTLGGIGSVAHADSYDGQDLTVGSLQYGNTIYNDVVATPGKLISVGGGLPLAARDVYSNGQLTIPALQAGTRVYTNVVMTVGSVISVGGIAHPSTFFDAPVQGLCYSTNPSLAATATPTDAGGNFQYVAGDLVSFWIDGTGGGCVGSTASSPYSVALGALLPTGSVTSVLSLAAGLPAADALNALNTGSPSLFNVGGLNLAPGDISNLDSFIGSEGAILPTGQGGSADGIDAFFNDVQADTTLAGGGAPAFVTAVPASTATATSALQESASNSMFLAAEDLPNQPSGYSIPSTGLLKFSLATNQYLTPLAGPSGALYVRPGASFVYYDGAGHVTQASNPGDATITAANLGDDTETGTYTISGATIVKTLSGVYLSSTAVNGDTYTLHQSLAARYIDAGTEIFTGTFTKTFTSGPYSGDVFASGKEIINTIVLTPLTLAAVANHTVTVDNGCGPGVSNVMTFTGHGSPATSVTLTQTCGGLPLTLTPAASLPGILEGTDSSGYIVYAGLFGAGLVPGAEFVVLQQAEGSLGSNGNGGLSQWNIGSPITRVQ
jgi:hypothetical protein